MTSDDQAGTGVGAPEGSSRARSPIVFISDASAEAERIGDTLRHAGYVVVDVPMSMLSPRVSAQRPNVVLLDVDADGALDEVARVRKLPGSAAIDFVYFGTGAATIASSEDALANDGSAFFVRPVDVGGLVRRIEALTGGPIARPEARPSTPPPSLAIGRMPGSTRGGDANRSADGPPSSERPNMQQLRGRSPGPPLPMSTTSLADLVETPRSLASFGTVSNELQQMLSDAERRAEVMSSPDVALPSPEEEIEAVLPADVLASLDEPIDGGEDEEPSPGDAGRGTRPGSHERDGTGAHAKGTTAGGTRQLTTGSQVRSPGTGAHARERRAGSDGPPRSVTGAGISKTPTSLTARARTTDASAPAMPALVEVSPRAPRAASSWHPPPSLGAAPPAAVGDLRGPSVGPAPRVASAVVLGPHDARRFLADAIASRATGALCFESDGVVRRIVIREGDLVAAASGGEVESLVHFLAARGDLPRDEAPRLAAKVPPYGRHAGAALVAHGWLRQDQLWVVLRAHAEWIASAVLRLGRGSAQLEPEPPGRLRGEPSVFGAATGAEIFVELVRRAVPHDDALDRLGGESSRVADGPNAALLAECSLPPQDLDLLQRARGGTISDLLARATDGEIVAVVHALALLGVLEIVPSVDALRSAPSLPEAEVAALDEEAIRTRVRARLEVVEEGNYFAVLGVSPDATGYEVRRAFVELRRAFEPSRILTPRLLDLADDVRKIVVVLEEAYEILRDNARRERYRRAIEARPE